MLEAIILAGGRGSRLNPVTEIVPKALLALPGGSLLDFQIEALLKTQVSTIKIVCGHLEEEIAQYVGLRYPQIQVISQKSEIGTAADGLLEIADSIERDFLVVHGDHYFSRAPFADLLANYQRGQITFLVEPPEKFASFGYGIRCSYDPRTREIHFLSQPRIGSESSVVEMILVDGCMVLPPVIFEIIRQARLEIRQRAEKLEMRHVFDYVGARSLILMKAIEVGGWWANINSPDIYAQTLKRMYRDLR